MRDNNKIACTGCDARLKSLERVLRMVLKKTGIEDEALKAAELDEVLDSCSGSLNFTELVDLLKNNHKDTEVAA